MFRKIIYLFVFHMLVLCEVSFAGRMSADELSAMMAEDVKIAQELINEMPAEERLAMVEKLSAGYGRLSGLVAEDLEKAYQEDGTGKTYVPAIPMVLEDAWRWRDADGKVNGVILKNIDYFLDPIWEDQIRARGLERRTSPQGWFLGCIALCHSLVSPEKVVDAIAAVPEDDARRDNKLRCLTFVLEDRLRRKYDWYKDSRPLPSGVLKAAERYKIIPESKANIDMVFSLLRSPSSRMTYFDRKYRLIQADLDGYGEYKRERDRRQSEQGAEIRKHLINYMWHQDKVGEILRDNVAKAGGKHGGDHSYGSPLHAAIMAIDCWNARKTEPLLFKYLAYHVDIPGTERLPRGARYPVLEPLRRLEIREESMVEEIGRTPEEDEARIHLLLYLMAERTNGGAQPLHGILKIHYGIKEDSDKPASLKKAVRILEDVNKAEELLP